MLPTLAAETGAEGRPDVLAYRMQSLPGAEIVDLGHFRGRPGLLFVFEPGCVWCRRQARLLNGLPDRCATAAQILGVGVRGSRASLLEEASVLRPRFPVFEASHEFTVALGGSTPTPLLVVFGRDGRILAHARGYQRAEPLAHLLSLAIGSNCATPAQSGGATST
jgi:hypothetical protein